MPAFLTKLLLIVRNRLRSQARLEGENLVLRGLCVPKTESGVT